MDTATLQEHLSETATRNVTRWLEEQKFAVYREELEALIANDQWQVLEDSFFQTIAFGTGGIRGATGIGSNRINKVTIGEATQALCLYAQAADSEAAQKGIVIACDTRLSSPDLSRFAAQVCAANGFKTYIFDSFRSTPELSFTVRQLGCAVGIVISASHNPPIDNGFKAYWSDGGQLVAPHDKGVMSVIADITEIQVADYAQATSDGRIVTIGKELDDLYLAAVVAEAEGTERGLAIAYSPLHGAGQTNTLPVLQAAGFTDISVVTEQMVPDGNFPTIENGKPNPEERAANDRVVALMLAKNADIAITNDPDADRIGVILRQGDRPVYLTGNQSAVLATDYVLSKKQAKGTLTSKHYIAKTIVTTDMLTALADHYGVTLYGDMLVGFKYIGELLLSKEQTDEIFVIGGEESYGLLKGAYARDKDGAAGALVLAESAAELKKTGKTLWDRLLELYAEHGLYIERLDNIVYPGASGFERMKRIMAQLRTSPPAAVEGHAITAILDYATLTRTDIATGATQPIVCKSGDVVVLEFGDVRRRATVRPSGTEPKLKVYTQWYEAAAGDDVSAQYDAAQAKLEGISRDLEGLLLQ
jgi:phosphoglucomutase